MTELYSQLKDIKLFSGLDERNYAETLTHLRTRVKHYKKGSILMLAGVKIKTIGIVLSGNVEISRIDFAGNRLIINQLKYPSMFGEALACAGIEISPVSLTALTEVKVLLIDYKRILKSSPTGFKFHDILITNMLSILAEKNLFLRQKLELMSKKTTRAKLSAYLLQTIETLKQNNIKIPYNRIQLADYLGVNRSAMSKELCKLRDEGVLEFRKNHFKIYDPSKLSFYANQSPDLKEN